MTELDNKAQVAQKAAINLQQVVDEERAKRAEAESYAKALIEEFANVNDFDEARSAFKNKLKDYAPKAIINIIGLAEGAESESVRAGLNKWILDWVMSDKVDGSNEDLSKLLKELKTT